MNVKKQIRKIIPPCLFRVYHFLLAWLGAIIFRFPSKGMVVIGVTGTSGKSTVVELIARIFEEAGWRTASFSSISFRLAGEVQRNQLKMTMPGRFSLQHFLAQAKQKNCRLAVIEVTSEGIIQYRHRFIDFDLLVFTNLSPEHIERHGGFENYKKAKGQLFASLSKGKKEKEFKETISIINLDDSQAPYFSSFLAGRKIGYSLEKKESSLNFTIKAEKIELEERGSTFEIQGEKFKLILPGRFNISNSLAAIAVGYAQGLGLKEMSQALAKVEKIPGRLESIIEKPFQVIVDYAHHPAALEKVYQTLHSKGELICVLGSCGGGRDRWKRPVLGEIASRYCRKIILTNEDPYEENPQEIIAQVAKGVKGKKEIILDRRKAIREALESASSGEVVIITGKGSETLMCVAGGKKIPWDDRQVVSQEWQKIKKESFPKEDDGRAGNL
jgi:UDP-N-acetylmuramoyl-L-alanyl-D-glutamate--2,6-diaminopimelate ligase